MDSTKRRAQYVNKYVVDTFSNAKAGDTIQTLVAIYDPKQCDMIDITIVDSVSFPGIQNSAVCVWTQPFVAFDKEFHGINIQFDAEMKNVEVELWTHGSGFHKKRQTEIYPCFMQDEFFRDIMASEMRWLVHLSEQRAAQLAQSRLDQVKRCLLDKYAPENDQLAPVLSRASIVDVKSGIRHDPSSPNDLYAMLFSLDPNFGSENSEYYMCYFFPLRNVFEDSVRFYIPTPLTYTFTRADINLKSLDSSILFKWNNEQMELILQRQGNYFKLEGTLNGVRRQFSLRLVAEPMDPETVRDVIDYCNARNANQEKLLSILHQSPPIPLTLTPRNYWYIFDDFKEKYLAWSTFAEGSALFNEHSGDLRSASKRTRTNGFVSEFKQLSM